MPKSVDYPLDVSTRFMKTSMIDIPFLNWRATNAVHGLITSPKTGDLTTDALMRAMIYIARQQLLGLAYADVIDTKIEDEQAELAAIRDQIHSIGLAVQAAVDTAQQTHADQLRLIELLGGVEVPAWRTKTEVDEGDDMGMDVFGAADLGLLVEFRFARQEPGFEDEQVISTEPPAGSLVLKGSTVVVHVNSEG